MFWMQASDRLPRSARSRHVSRVVTRAPEQNPREGCQVRQAIAVLFEPLLELGKQRGLQRVERQHLADFPALPLRTRGLISLLEIAKCDLPGVRAWLSFE